MANATVEKIKDVGLRHGEKAVVGLTAALCLAFAWLAFSRPTIDLTPEQIEQVAKRAASNISAEQDAKVIDEKLVEEGMKNPGFEQIVNLQVQTPLHAEPYKVANPWITPEPGAGLIREQPVLIAATNLYAYPGRGGALVYTLDEQGKRIPMEEGAAEVAAVSRGKRFRRAGGQGSGSGSGMSGMMGSGSGMSGMSGMAGGGMTAEQEAADLKLFEAEKKRLQSKLVGAVDDAEKAKLEEEMTELEQSQIPKKEALRGLRWVVITATLDHKKMRENYLDALVDPSVADPYYKKVDVERQIRQPDGSWSDWTAVDRAENLKILDNLPDEDEEITTEDVRIPELVDQLPFLKAGYWEKVHVASLVPRDRREIAPPVNARQGGMMAGTGSSGMSGSSGMMDSSSSAGMSDMAGMSGMGMSSGMEGMSGSGMGMGMGMGAGETLNFTKTEAETIMVRSLDFSVEQDTTYRFRLRVVVRNPNLGRDDVAAGVDVTSPELSGPWSDPTDEVSMPADVTAYAVRKTPSASPGSEQVEFQVTRWNPEDGFTTVRVFNAGPGQIIGEPRDAPVPATDGTGAKNKRIDFNSRQVVLDAMGGDQPVPSMPNMVGSRFEVPALSLVVRHDGSVLVRNQARDLNDEVRRDMEANYKREIDESNQNREMRAGQGMMGMPGMSGSSGMGLPGRRGGRSPRGSGGS